MSKSARPILKFIYKCTNRAKYKQIKEEQRIQRRVEAYTGTYSGIIAAIMKRIETKEVLNFKHSGHIGDLVYALPVIKELAKTHKCRLYVAVNVPLPVKTYYRHPAGSVMINQKIASLLLPLLREQEYLEEAEVLGPQEIDIDLDLFRELPVQFSFLSHRWYFHIAGVQPDLSQAYLEASEHPHIKNKVVIVRSFRARNYFVDYSFLSSYHDLLFIGMRDEYEDMRQVVPNLGFYDVKDFYEMAQIIKASRFFLGNQSFAYAVADGLKVPRLLEANPEFPVVQPLGRDSYDFYFQEHFEAFFKKLYNRAC